MNGQLEGSVGRDPGQFPADVLGAIEGAFGWLCTRPHPVTLDGGVVVGLPAAPVPLDEVRARLLDPATPTQVRDVVWAHLVRRARTDGPSWTIAAAGMALPMLAGLARLLCARFEGDASGIRAELVAGFVAALGTVDPDRHPFLSLRWAAYRAGHAAVLEALAAPRPVSDDTEPGPVPGARGAAGGDDVNDVDDAADANSGSAPHSGRRSQARESAPPPARPGHPDLVLARAVSEGILTVPEAALIGSTRLEAVTLAEAAAALGTGASTAYSRRYRAEARLLAHLIDTGGPETLDQTTRTAPGNDARPPQRTRTAGSPRRRRRTRRTRSAGSDPASAVIAATQTTATQTTTARSPAAQTPSGTGASVPAGRDHAAVQR